MTLSLDATQFFYSSNKQCYQFLFSNTFYLNVSFLYSLKMSENLWTIGLKWVKKWALVTKNGLENQKQPPRGALRKRCSEDMRQIYRRAPKPKCETASGKPYLRKMSHSQWNLHYKYIQMIRVYFDMLHLHDNYQY